MSRVTDELSDVKLDSERENGIALIATMKPLLKLNQDRFPDPENEARVGLNDDLLAQQKE